MGWKAIPDSAERFPAPRQRPLLYPGERPDGSFLLAAGAVFPLRPRQTIARSRVMLNAQGDTRSLANYLDIKRLPSLGSRFAVIGYGSNPVPGQLCDKLGDDAVVPVVYGAIRGFEIVYNLISNRGYAYAELVPGGPGSQARVGITLLDRQQLWRMVGSEANYHLARAPRAVILDSGRRLKAERLYLFAGKRRVWAPHPRNRPVAVAGLDSPRSRLEPLAQAEALSLAIQQFNLEAIGIDSPQALVERLRREARAPDQPGKLKHDLQAQVDADPRSLPPLADSLSLVADATRLATFSD